MFKVSEQMLELRYHGTTDLFGTSAQAVAERLRDKKSDVH